MPNTLAKAPPDSILLVDRGNVASPDFTDSDITADGDPHDLDFSEIVPAGAKFIWLTILFSMADGVGDLGFFQKSVGPQSNALSTMALTTGVVATVDGFVACDPSRILTYCSSPATYDQISIVVRGWIM